jgi:hypothetical protein
LAISAVEVTTVGVNKFRSAWRPRLGNRRVGCPQAKWDDELRRKTGGSWMRVAEDLARLRAIGETYVQQWTVMG